MKLVKLTSKALSLLASRCWGSEDAFDLVREVLVEGRGTAEVAKEHGSSRQYVHKMVTQIRDAFDRDPQPSSYVELETPIPFVLATAIERLLQSLSKESPDSDSVLAVAKQLEELAEEIRNRP